MKHKKKILALAMLLAATSVVGCSKSKKGSDSIDTSSLISVSSNEGNTSTSSSKGSSVSSSTSSSIPSDVHPADTVRIHFNSSLNGYAFWIWAKGVDGKSYTKTSSDSFGDIVEINPLDEFGTNSNNGILLLLKDADSWDFQTGDYAIDYTEYIPTLEGGKYVLDIYVVLSRDELLIFKTENEAKKEKVYTAVLDSTLKNITITTDGIVEKVILYKLDETYYSKKFNNQYVSLEQYKLKEYSISSTENVITVQMEGSYTLNEGYMVGVIFKKDNSYESYANVVPNDVDLVKLIDNFSYSGYDLGVTFTKENDEITSTTFKVWSPCSYSIVLNLYKYGNNSSYMKSLSSSMKNEYDKPVESYMMKIDETGTYSITLPKNLEGYYYTYLITNCNGEKETIDPYAKSAGIDGNRGLVVDFDGEKLKDDEFDSIPLKWDGVEGYDIESSQDLVISENHIRDLTMDETWSSSSSDRELAGTFEGFIKKGTTYSSGGISVKTGFDHLEEYGVNAIQLLPIFDQENYEDKDSMVYNWGYNPQNYNVVEGGYSSDPYDGYARIKEFKHLISAFAHNKNKTRIIMDVVYNHVASTSTNALNITVPKYYFRLSSDGYYMNGSGCGNEFRSESAMGRKFIVDSLKFWATTYKVKGFRFDLMGLIDCLTLKIAKEELYKIDPDIVIYGEGWTGDGSSNPERAITESIYSQLYESNESPGYVGGFNDAGRNAFRGDNGGGEFATPGYGFISQGSGDASLENRNKVASMMKGIHLGKGNNPKQTINYVSCHDNFTLFDQLNYTLSDDGGISEPSIEKVARASVAVNGSILFSNGVAFVHGGEEIFRSKELTSIDPVDKYGESKMFGKRISHNSYKSSDECNSYKYDRKLLLLDYFNMYKDLVSIRKDLANAYMNSEYTIDEAECNSWGESNTNLGVYRKGKGDYNYYLYINGRPTNGQIGSGEQEELIFNNTSSNPTFYDWKYTIPEQYQLVIYRTHKS